MALYGDDTLNIIKQLTHEHLDIAEEDGVVVLAVSDEEFEAILPTSGMLAKSVLLRPQQARESMKALAERYGVANSTISAVTRKNPGRPVRRELALRSLMLMDPMPDPEEADHMLMQVGVSGLYVSTGWKEENRRNWLLRELLTYCGSKPFPEGGWLAFANRVLLEFDMKALSNHLPAPDAAPLPAHKLEQWRIQIQSVGFQDYSILRGEFLNRYMEGRGLNYHGAVRATHERLAREASMAVDTVRGLFGKMTSENSKGSRDNLIALAVALGCSLKEANTMLLQANQALLYPKRSRLDELEWVKQLCLNNPNEIM